MHYISYLTDDNCGLDKYWSSKKFFFILQQRSPPQFIASEPLAFLALLFSLWFKILLLPIWANPTFDYGFALKACRKSTTIIDTRMVWLQKYRGWNDSDRCHWCWPGTLHIVVILISHLKINLKCSIKQIHW